MSRLIRVAADTLVVGDDQHRPTRRESEFAKEVGSS
jgi:hypothetical protein